MALPGRRGPVLSTWKVSIGERKSKTAPPRAMDYITIRYYDRAKEVWVVHPDLQARLCEITGSEKPQWCPVISPYGELERAVFTELAAWGSNNRNVCRCGRWVQKSRETCEQQGLPYPPAGGWENAGPAYFVGTATRTRWRQGPPPHHYPVPLEKVQVPCDPHTCAFAQGRWDHAGRVEYRDAYGAWPSEKVVEEGRKLCGIHCVVPLLLPFVEDESPRAFYSTPSWYSSAGLMRSWAEIRDMAGGVIAGLPLKLVLEFPRLRTPMGMQHLGVVHFEPGVPWRELPALGEAKARALRESVEAQRELASHLKMLDGVVEETEAEYTDAFVGEHDLAAGGEPSIADFMEERFRAVASEAGWTGAAIDSFVAEASAEELVRQIAAMEGEEEATDAEFSEEPEADGGAQDEPPPDDEPPVEWDEEEDPFPNAPETKARRLIPEEGAE